MSFCLGVPIYPNLPTFLRNIHPIYSLSPLNKANFIIPYRFTVHVYTGKRQGIMKRALYKFRFTLHHNKCIHYVMIRKCPAFYQLSPCLL